MPVDDSERRGGDDEPNLELPVDERVTQTMRISVSASEPVTTRREKDPPSPHRDSRESLSIEYERLLESVYDAVLLTDQNGKIIDYNARTSEYFACEEGHLPWTNVVDFISGAEAGLIETLHQNLQGERYYLIEAYCRRADGSLFPAEIAVNDIDLPRGRQLCFFVRDITARKRAQDALENAVAKLEAHDRARSEFVDNVSHELRTPLTSMIYAISNMLKGVVGDLPPRVRYYLEIIDGDSKRLWATINDILDMSRIEQGRLTLSRSAVPLAPLVLRSAQTLKLQADVKTQAFSIDAGGGGWFVDCDPPKMERVVLNVVSNAIKYTQEHGEITVRIRDAEQDGFVAIEVEDSGIGIPAEALQRVTERYYRVGELVSGSGLGLPISKELMELHGGDMQIVSPPPDRMHGTLVRLLLPAIEGPRILLVGPDDVDREEMAVFFSRTGYRLTMAANVSEALGCLSASAHELVIARMEIPGDDGYALILQMQSDRSIASIPVVALVDSEPSAARSEILEHFALCVLSKPWQKDDLDAAVSGAFIGKASFVT